MRIYLFATILICFITRNLYSQNDYSHIDSLLEKGSFVDKYKVLELLKNFSELEKGKPEYWSALAKASYYNSLYSDVHSQIDKAISLDSNNSFYYFEKAQYHYDFDIDPNKSLACISRAIELRPDPLYYLYRGGYYSLLARDDEAFADFKFAFDSGLKDVGIFRNYGTYLIKKQLFKEALEVIDEGIVLHPKSSECYSIKCNVLLHYLDVDGACEAYQTALKLGYKSYSDYREEICASKNLFKLAVFIVMEGDFKNGLKGFEIVLKENEGQADIYLSIGYCYYGMKDFETAEKYYLLAEKRNNCDMNQLYNNLSVLHYDQGEIKKSIYYSTKQIALDPNNPIPYIDRGTNYRELKEFENARIDINKAIKLNSSFFRAYAYRSRLNSDTGDFDAALDDAVKALELNPNYAFGYYVLAMAKQNLKINGFCDDYQKAYALGYPIALKAIDAFCK